MMDASKISWHDAYRYCRRRPGRRYPGPRHLREWFPELSAVTEADCLQSDPEADWIPAVDVFDTGDTIVVRAELPGVKKDDVKITLENDLLWLRGERRPEESNKLSYLCSEWLYGRFSRKVRLPYGVRKDGIVTTLRDGVLEVVFQKDVSETRREVQID